MSCAKTIDFPFGLWRVTGICRTGKWRTKKWGGGGNCRTGK